MSDIPSANQKIQIEATQYRAPVSESLAQTMGGSINYALDGIASNASAISTETTNRIAGDAAINSTLSTKTAVRYRATSSFNTLIGDNGTHGGGSLIDTQTLTITGTASDEFALINFVWYWSDTSRDEAYFEVETSNHSTASYDGAIIGTGFSGQSSLAIPNPGGFSSTLFLGNFISNTATITVKLYASNPPSGSSQRQRVQMICTAARFDRSATLSGT